MISVHGDSSWANDAGQRRHTHKRNGHRKLHVLHQIRFWANAELSIEPLLTTRLTRRDVSFFKNTHVKWLQHIDSHFVDDLFSQKTHIVLHILTTLLIYCSLWQSNTMQTKPLIENACISRGNIKAIAVQLIKDLGRNPYLLLSSILVNKLVEWSSTRHPYAV